MNPKELFEKGMTFSEFVEMDKDSYKEKILEIYSSIKFKAEVVDRIKSINKTINVLICAEMWCPDCMINVPVVEKMREINKDIHISIVGKDENEEFFKKYSNSEILKIPTFIFFDEYFNVLGYFVERPNIVKEASMSSNQVDVIVTMRKYRRGEYTLETLEDILNIIAFD